MDSRTELQGREHWGSRIGVIMAVAGSAVGLGNFLRFPGQAAQYGGGAFMIAYFLSLLAIGLPICWAEWAMGRRAGQAGYHSAPGIFHYFMGRAGKYWGVVGVIVPVVIYMYYVMIESWCLGYALNFLMGAMHFGSPAEAKEFFAKFVGLGENGSAMQMSLQTALPYLILAYVLNFWLIYRGLSRGIELFCTYAMPALLLLALVVLVRVMTLGTPDANFPDRNVENGLGFMWNPVKTILQVRDGEGNWKKEEEVIGDRLLEQAWKKVEAEPEKYRIREVGVLEQLSNPQLWLAAAGQIFFSLSVGFGVILVYASYLRKEDDVVLSGLSATSANELCEVGLGGLITLPAAVAFLGIGTVAGMTSTFALGFNVLPMVFSQMPLGFVFGFFFFFLLFLAAITSSLSMLQPGIAFLEESLGVGRKVSVALLGFITVCGTAFVVYFSRDLKALDTLDFWVGTFLIFILATLQVIVFGWVWGAQNGIDEANRGSILRLSPLWAFVLRYISPSFLLAIFVLWMAENVLGIPLQGGTARTSSYIVDLFVEPNLVAWLSVGIMLAVGGLVALLAANSKRYRQENR